MAARRSASEGQELVQQSRIRGRSCHERPLFHMAEHAKPHPWRMPIPTEELEPASAPLFVGPIALWQSAMVTKYDLMLIEFSRDGTNWTTAQRSENVLARETRERAVHDHRDRPTQRIYARDHQSVS